MPLNRFSSRGAPRLQTRWTPWELVLLSISAMLIMSPLFAAGYALLVPRAVPAQGQTKPQPPALATWTPVPGPGTPSATPPPATNTPIATPTATQAPTIAATPTTSSCGATGYPVCTPVPPTATTAPPTAVPPTATTAMLPTATAVPPTATAVPPTATTAVPPTATTSTPSQLAISVSALDTGGRNIASVASGDVFNYYVRVDNAVMPAVPVTLSDILPAGIQPVQVLNTIAGSCAVSGQTLSCTLSPSTGRPASVMIQVRAGAVTPGSTIVNAATVRDSSTNTQATDSAKLTVSGSVATATAVPPTATVAPPGPTAVPPTAAPPATAMPAVQPAPSAPQPTSAPLPTDVPRPPAPRSPQRPPSRGSQPTPTLGILPVTVVPGSVPWSTQVPEVTAQPINTVAPPATSTPRRSTQPQPTAAKPASGHATTAPATTQPTTGGARVSRPAASATTAPKPSATRQIGRAAGAAPTPAARATAPHVAPEGAAPTTATAQGARPATTTPAQGARPATTAPTATPAPTLAPVTTPIKADAAERSVSARFNLQSDWGQAAIGETVVYTVTLQNAGLAAGGSAPIIAKTMAKPASPPQGLPMTDIVIGDDLNEYLEPIEVRGIGLTASWDGQRIEATRAKLNSGETVQLVIAARVRHDATLDTIQNQASLRYTGRDAAIFSNLVEVKVVRKDAAPSTTETAQAAAPSTRGPAGKAAETTKKAAPAELGTQLPHTSGGSLPLSGILLLGLTLLIRSVRTHRARVRI